MEIAKFYSLKAVKENKCKQLMMNFAAVASRVLKYQGEKQVHYILALAKTEACSSSCRSSNKPKGIINQSKRSLVNLGH